MSERPPFPGAIGVTHLRVYDTEAPDGLAGGTPHLHTVCTEAYAVVGGNGRVQTLTGSGFGERRLEAGAFVWFTPGTIHRLVNEGDLEILVLMQNAGLPEAGDMVITFPPEVMNDDDAYIAAASLPPGELTTAGSGVAARERRDAAVLAFTTLRDAFDAGDRAPLDAFHAAAARLVRPQVDAWRKRWEKGPFAEANRTGALLDSLASGDGSYLAGSSVHAIPPPPNERRMGCCGTLGTFAPGGTDG
jgi:mannose-6-phosphate isomerase-like protein (cupin superfamily)